MIKLTYGRVSTNSFVSSVQRLAHTQMAAKPAYTLQRIIAAIESKKKDIGKEWLGVLKDLVVFEGAAPKLDEKGAMIFNTPETEAKFKSFDEVFPATEFTINFVPIHHSVLAGVPFTPVDVGVLADIIQFEDVVSEGDNVIPIHRQAASQVPPPSSL